MAGVSLAAGLLAQEALAQQVASADVQQLSIEQLANVEITSVSRRPESLSQAPAIIFVISAEDIRRSGAINLPEGVAHGAQSGSGAHERLRLHHHGARFQFSGILQQAAGAGGWTQRLFSARQQRVLGKCRCAAGRCRKLHRSRVSGPGGTLYGANAVNGVINIVTKEAGETQGALLDATIGTTDAKITARYGFAPWDGGSLRLYAQTSHANNTSRLLAVDPARTAWARNQGGFRLDQEFDGDSLTVQGDIFANSTPAMALERGWRL